MNETTCIICDDDYGDIADEALLEGVCLDCWDTYTLEELIEKGLERDG